MCHWRGLKQIAGLKQEKFSLITEDFEFKFQFRCETRIGSVESLFSEFCFSAQQVRKPLELEFGK
jgi:hypothetical protein